MWGRFRYDLVAFAALMVAVLAGFVHPEEAFAGFGHPAVVIVALVLVISRGLTNSGAVELIGRRLLSPDRGLPGHISVMAVAGAAMSALMNNVAALALLMTLDIEAAQKARRAASLSLMPLSFATILGGMITLIGTPPNIVIAEFRREEMGAPYAMFDFAPVGLAVAVAGIAFVALVGWRLIPERRDVLSADDEAGLFVAEAKVAKDSQSEGKRVADLYDLANTHDIAVLGLVRNHKRLPGFQRHETLRAGDFLVLEGDPANIEAFMGAAGLVVAGTEEHATLRGKSLSLIECVVPDDSRIVGRSAMDLRLSYRQGVALMGVSRGGRAFRDRVRKLPIRRGDTLLLIGPDDNLDNAVQWLGVLPIANRRTEVVQRSKALAAIAAFAGAILLSVLGIATLDIALGLCLIAYLALGLIGRDIYDQIDWKVIVLLASLIPLSKALEASGGTELIATGIVAGLAAAPAWLILSAVMVVTMVLSDFLNNVATALIAAPIAVGIAGKIGANPDTFLMGVAVAASCAFLTPIGHKNNTIIMGPGNYRFSDYWRMGLVLELVVLAVGIPMLLLVWPLAG
ncbi:MAG: SLC13 family permease [Paracoccaceae bacterium]